MAEEHSDDVGIRAMVADDVPEVLALERRLFPLDAWPEHFFHQELAQADPAAGEPSRSYWVAQQVKPASGPGGPGFTGSGADGGSSEADLGSQETWDSGETLGSRPESAIIAYAGMMCVLPLADVQTLAVAPAAQGRRLGSRLLELMEAEARERGAEDLLLEVRADNPGAQRLYRRHGFEQIHQRPRYYADGGEALIMRKHLQDAAPSTAANLRSP